MVSGPLADHAPVPAPFWRVTASGFDGFGSGHSDIEFKGQCAIRKETQWLPWCFALNSVRQPHYLLTWKNEFLWTLVFRIKLYSLYSPSGISCQAKNHRTDISKRKLNVIFLIVYFSFQFFSPLFIGETRWKKRQEPLPHSGSLREQRQNGPGYGPSRVLTRGDDGPV